jgi:hypothetical protein
MAQIAAVKAIKRENAQSAATYALPVARLFH